MSWGDESWHTAAHDYHAGRKRDRRQGNSHMEFEREKPAAKIIPLGNHREQPEEIRPPAFSDDALALRFIDEPKDTLRYVPSLGKWLRWDGQRWCFDERLIAHDRMRKVCRAAAAECNQPKVAKLIASNKTAAAAERFARSDQRIIATVDELDADQWLLNTPGGTIDLRTGKEWPHRQGDLLTKITGIARMHRVRHRFGVRFLPGSPTTSPSCQHTFNAWPGIPSLVRHKSTPFSSSMGSAQTERQLSSMPLRLAPETIIARLQSRHLRRHLLTVIPRTSRACVARVSSPLSRLRKGAVGPRAESSRSPAETRSRRGSCGRTSSSIRRSSSSSSLAIISRASSRWTRQSGGVSTSFLSPSLSHPTSATKHCPRNSRPNYQASCNG